MNMSASKKTKVLVDGEFFGGEAVDAEDVEDAEVLALDTLKQKKRHRGLRNVNDYSDDDAPGLNWDDDVDVDVEGDDAGEEAMAEQGAVSLSGSDGEDERFEPFSLEIDREEGHFDSEGFFVRSAPDADADQDRWLNNVTREDIAKARRAHQRQFQHGEKARPVQDVSATFAQILQLMQPGQSVLEALNSRKSQTKPLSPPVNKNRRKKMARAGTVPSATGGEYVAKVEIEQLTDLAMNLFNRGHFSIYDETYESIRAKLEA